MNPSRKRTILLVATVLVGSVLVLFDAPLELVLLGTTAIGMMLLVLLGGLKKEEEEQPAETAKDKTEKETQKDGDSLLKKMLPGITRLLSRKSSKNETAPPATPDTPPGRSVPFSGLRERIAGTSIKNYAGMARGIFGSSGQILTSIFRKKPAGPEDLKKIDDMLDRAVAEPVSQDDFPGFDDFDLDLDESADFMSGDAPAPAHAQSKMELEELDALAVNDILDAAGDNLDGELPDDFSFDFDTEVEDMLASAGEEEPDRAEPVSAAPGLDIPDAGDMPPFPTGNAGGGEAEISLSEMPDMESLSPLSDLEGDFGELDGIELGDIEIEEEAVQEESLSAPADVPKTPPAKPQPVEEPVIVVEDEIGSFGASDGSMSFMDELKSETRVVKSTLDVSLLRELKDVSVEAEELVSELEGVNDYLSRQIHTARKSVNTPDR
ncbi:MAG: hypothetical protein APR53_00420 [Methanoculleus sp. SDB]|nr:MAG: hypothetical protein APR53_00420 [Methanoculleus sp. SDB]